MGANCTKCWYRNTSCVEHALMKVFRKWGLFVATHPLITILLSLTLAASLSIFVLFIEAESQLDQLYAPKGTISWQNYMKYKETWDQFEDHIGINNVIVYHSSNPSHNIFTLEYLTLFQQIYDEVHAIEVEYNDTTYKYQDICYRYENDNCATRSILELYQFNQRIMESTFNTTLIAYPVTYSSYSDKQLFIPMVLGQNVTTKYIDMSPPGASANNFIQIVTESPAFQTTFMIDIGLFGDEICSLWYKQFLAVINEWATNPEKNSVFTVTYEGYNSFNDELTKAVASDITSFVTGFVLLSVFSTLMILRFQKTECCNGKLYKLNMKRCRARVGWVGTLSSVLAVGSSFGLVGGIFGVKFNSVVSVAPFLLVGLGLDDMFVLLRSYELTSPSLSIPERFALTMERGGISIMFTSVTDLLAFCVGSTSVFGSISAFCLYCGVGVFLDFVFQVSFFLAFMVYDSRWQETQSLQCCQDHDTINASQIPFVSVNSEEVELETKPTENTRTRKLSHLLPPTIPPEASSFLMDKLAEFLLSSIWIKCMVIVLFICYLAGATYGILGLTAYQNPEDLAPTNSYLRKIYDSYERYFNTIGAPIEFIFDKPLDYSDSKVAEGIYSMLQSIRNDECFLNDSSYTTAWIYSYHQYLQRSDNPNINSTLFYDILYDEYLVNSGESFIRDIWDAIIVHDSNHILNNTDIFNEETLGNNSYKQIERSRVYLNLKPSENIGTEGTKDCLDNFKRLQNEYSELGIYYFAGLAVFAESDLITIQQTIYNLIYACSAASLITMILIPYPLMALFVMTTVAQIMWGVLGYMSLWGLPINTTTMINIVISVGFSVDNSAHFCHAFMNAPISIKFKSKSEERKARVIYGLNAVGMPILAGDLSTIIALLPLSTAESEIFLSFWKCISLVMLFGISYAMLYLPVMLSMIGPLGFEDIVNDTDNKNKKYREMSIKHSDDNTMYTLME